MRIIMMLVVVGSAIGGVSCSSPRTREIEKALAVLHRTVEQLRTEWQAQMSALSNRVAALEAEQMLANRGGGASADDMLASAMTTLEEEVSRLARIVDTTGIEDAATNDVDPQVLRDVLKEYTERRRVAEVRQRLHRRNEELHAQDRNLYGEGLRELYERARFRWGRGRRSNEEREKAFQEMLQSYPEANATAMVAAERALGALFRGNLEEAERYHAFLQGNPKFAEVVTDWGIEALPAIQTGLAHAYLQRNRRQEAEQLLNNLERNYSSSYILVPGGGPRGGFEPRWERVSDVVARLRARM
ncbi:MAG: hypothetical protein N2595_01015 [bacterium]|nr:hypothetical protein [bacterium]